MELIGVDISFRKIGSGFPRPFLPVTIINSATHEHINIWGLIDTGADECALPAEFASKLGHNLQKGSSRTIGTGNGETVAYSHTVKIKAGDYTTQNVLIDFMPNLNTPLLGVKSFLSNFILKVNYLEQKFSLLHSKVE